MGFEPRLHNRLDPDGFTDAEITQPDQTEGIRFKHTLWSGTDRPELFDLYLSIEANLRTEYPDALEQDSGSPGDQNAYLTLTLTPEQAGAELIDIVVQTNKLVEALRKLFPQPDYTIDVAHTREDEEYNTMPGRITIEFHGKALQDPVTHFIDANKKLNAMARELGDESKECYEFLEIPEWRTAENTRKIPSFFTSASASPKEPTAFTPEEERRVEIMAEHWFNLGKVAKADDHRGFGTGLPDFEPDLQEKIKDLALGWFPYKPAEGKKLEPVSQFHHREFTSTLKGWLHDELTKDTDVKPAKATPPRARTFEDRIKQTVSTVKAAAEECFPLNKEFNIGDTTSLRAKMAGFVSNREKDKIIALAPAIYQRNVPATGTIVTPYKHDLFAREVENLLRELWKPSVTRGYDER